MLVTKAEDCNRVDDLNQKHTLCNEDATIWRRLRCAGGEGASGACSLWEVEGVVVGFMYLDITLQRADSTAYQPG